MAGGLNCYFGCMGGFSECDLSLDCRFISGVQYMGGRIETPSPDCTWPAGEGARRRRRRRPALRSRPAA
eukprot:SAG25_NODE_1986_length_2058_cov_3.416029_1_plen_68_part_10